MSYMHKKVIDNNPLGGNRDRSRAIIRDAKY